MNVFNEPLFIVEIIRQADAAQQRAQLAGPKRLSREHALMQAAKDVLSDIAMLQRFDNQTRPEHRSTDSPD
jgi:hypothetical protein